MDRTLGLDGTTVPEATAGLPSAPASQTSSAYDLQAEACSQPELAGSSETLISASTQTAELADAAVQYELLTVTEEERQQQLSTAAMASFLHWAAPLCEQALQQNELVDPLADELAALADEEAGDGVPAAGSAVGTSGTDAARVSTSTVEHLQSFSDLVHSKTKVVSAVQWHPSRRGVVAVACMQPSQAQAEPGQQQPIKQPPLGCILLWNQADAIHPEVVLQAPAEVTCMAFNAAQPAVLAAGLVTGQVVLFSLQQLQPGTQSAAAAGAATTAPAGSAPAAALADVAQPSAAGPAQASAANQPHLAHASSSESNRDSSSLVAALQPSHTSAPEACHQAAVSGLRWLRGAHVSRDGRLEAAPEGADHCTLFATTAADGNLLLWDMRVSTKLRKNAKDDEQPDWKPVLSLAASSSSNLPLMVTCFCLDAGGACLGRFMLGSLDGELAAVNAAMPSFEHKGSTEWVHHTVQRIAGHMGRIVSLAFSPFFKDTLLAVAGSGFMLLRVSCDGDGSKWAASCLPLFESTTAVAMYTCGCWSTTKPGVILVGRQDGRLEVWDLLDRTHQAVVVAFVGPSPLTALAATAQQLAPQLVAVGDASGTLHLLELPRALRRRGHTEVIAMATLLQHEQGRCEASARRVAERAAQLKAEADRQRAEGAAGQTATRRQQLQDEDSRQPLRKLEIDSQQAELRYLELEAKWRELLGLPPAVTAPLATLAQ